MVPPGSENGRDVQRGSQTEQDMGHRIMRELDTPEGKKSFVDSSSLARMCIDDRPL